jgi:hypothetical protein
MLKVVDCGEDEMGTERQEMKTKVKRPGIPARRRREE